MAPQQLVYVHGAGPQKPATALKHELDLLLFGKDMSTTRLAHYAGVRWPPGTGGTTIAAAASGRERRARAIRRSTDPTLTTDAAADEIVSATLRGPAGAGLAPGVDRCRDPARPDARPAALPTCRSHRQQLGDTDARRCVGPTFPDPIFRFIVGKFASDVIDYLYGPFRAADAGAGARGAQQTPSPR